MSPLPSNSNVPSASGGMAGQPVPMPAASESTVTTIIMSKSVNTDPVFTGGPGGVTVRLPGMGTTRIGEGMNARPTDTVADDEEMVCMKRKKRRLGSTQYA